jgi:hypothetical protein
MSKRFPVAVLAAAAIPFSVLSLATPSVPVEFICGGDRVRGEFFPSAPHTRESSGRSARV